MIKTYLFYKEEYILQHFLNFDKMITPTIIKVLFWVGVGLSALSGFSLFVTGIGQMVSRFGSGFMGFLTIIFGIVVFSVGVLFARIYCELLIVIFKIQGTLTSIDEKMDK